MPESPSRRLVAILAAAIAGYSALMGADEARTVRENGTIIPGVVVKWDETSGHAGDLH
jgi:hypothetical protein